MHPSIPYMHRPLVDCEPPKLEIHKACFKDPSSKSVTPRLRIRTAEDPPRAGFNWPPSGTDWQPLAGLARQALDLDLRPCSKPFSEKNTVSLGKLALNSRIKAANATPVEVLQSFARPRHSRTHTHTHKKKKKEANHPNKQTSKQARDRELLGANPGSLPMSPNVQVEGSG